MLDGAVIGETIGNFRITSRLGAGGMGEVFLAEQKNIETKVAIKVLRPEISVDRQHVDRFFNEARAVSRIKHAGTVKIFDVGFHATGHAYLVMEFLEGETLAARIHRTTRLSVAQICDIGKQTCGVLEATHSAGITHRDLKPDNIFLVSDAELASGERVKILDFGIAKLTGTTAAGGPRTVGTMGTPAYMAPEQWGDAAKVDWRADIYSLGCVMFEMATGRPPFVADNFAQACGMHLSQLPPKLRSITGDAPAQLETMIDAMLAKSSYDRPPLREIAKQLAQLAEQPHQPYAPTPSTGHAPVAPTMAADAPTHAPVVHAPTPVHQQTPQHPGASSPAIAPVSATVPVVPPPSQTTLSSASGAMPAPPRKSKAGLYAIGGLVAVGGIVTAVVVGGGGGSGSGDPKRKVTTPVDAAVVTTPPDAAVVVEPPQIQSTAIGIVFDRSESMAGAKLDAVKQTLRDLLDRRKQNDQLFAIGLDGVATMMVNPTVIAARSALTDAINKIDSGRLLPGRPPGESLVHGLVRAHQMITSMKATAKHVVVITDRLVLGDGLVDALVKLRSDKVRVSFIGLGNVDALLVRNLSGVSGGGFMTATKPAELSSKVETALSFSWSPLTFYPGFLQSNGVEVMADQVKRWQYAAYLASLDRALVAKATPVKDWSSDRPFEPVGWVTHEQATAFCKVAGGRLLSSEAWLEAAGGSWMIEDRIGDEVIFREWTSTVTADGLAVALGGTSKMTEAARMAAVKNPLSKPTEASAGPNPTPESVASATIGIRCGK
jgi:serine/threonine protein kinase